jgi:hypothetical protein
MKKIQPYKRESTQTGADGMSRKDLLTLLASAGALTVSIGTLGFAQWEKRLERRDTSRKLNFSAFQLGKGFASSLLLYIHTADDGGGKGTDLRKKAIDLARMTEIYAIPLDLRIPLEPLIIQYDSKATQPIQDPSSAIESRLVGALGQSVSDKFSTAYWLTWLNFMGRATFDKRPENIDLYRQSYANVAPHINEELANVGVKARIDQTASELKKVIEQTQRALDELQAKLGE